MVATFRLLTMALLIAPSICGFRPSILIRSASRFVRQTSQQGSTSPANEHLSQDVIPEYTVTWKTPDGHISFPAFEGETVRTAALRRGIVSPHNGKARLINCRGLGTCGTCAVEIEGQVHPTERSQAEKLRLSFPPHGGSQSSALRLACQVQVLGDIAITKRTGFWGQHGSIADISEAQTYFGELEYLLDRKSPNMPTGTSQQSDL
jgi:ferredoxin